MAQTDFSLDPRIAADTAWVADLGLCQVRLMNDSRFPWLVLSPRRAGATEITDLSPADRAALIEETAQAAAALRRVAPCDKINIGALGNIVAQLHIHIVARRRADAAWPGPVWGAGVAVSHAPAALEALAQAVAAELQGGSDNATV